MAKAAKESKGSRCLFFMVKRLYKVDTCWISPKKIFYLFFYQRVLKFNSHVPWPVHYTSYVTGVENIKLSRGVYPGIAAHCYIQGTNGIIFGSNVRIASGCKIISANHNFDDYDKIVECRPIVIGNNVWIGTNAVVLPGVHIGENVIIGAGSVVTKDIPENSIAVGSPCRVIEEKGPYKGEKWD